MTRHSRAAWAVDDDEGVDAAHHRLRAIQRQRSAPLSIGICEVGVESSGIVRVRSVQPKSQVHMTWQPVNWERPSILQVGAMESGCGRGIIAFHHETLPDDETREAMRSHGKTILAELHKRV